MESTGFGAVWPSPQSAVSLMTVAIVWLAGAADTIAYQTYTLYFKRQSLDGLAIGSPVKMRGIKVGVVDSYRFAKGGDEAVSVTARTGQSTGSTAVTAGGRRQWRASVMCPWTARRSVRNPPAAHLGVVGRQDHDDLVVHVAQEVGEERSVPAVVLDQPSAPGRFADRPAVTVVRVRGGAFLDVAAEHLFFLGRG